MKILKAAPIWTDLCVDCKACRTELEIEFSDLRRIHHVAGPDQRDSAWDDVFVKCPECDAKIAINHVPSHLIHWIPIV